MLILLLVKNAAVLALLLACAAAAGTLAIGPREGLAIRSALGLALCAHACFFLGVIGQLRPAPILGIVLMLAVGVALRMRMERRTEELRSGQVPLLVQGVFALGGILLFVLALYPPFAFDETLYHLPYVQAYASGGGLRFLPDLRFPVFPVLHELLCVPPFLLAGDVGTHVVSLAQGILIAALLIEWGRRHDVRAGWLGAAIFLGSPLVVQLSTVLYVDIALTLFIVAGFYALERERYALAGLFFGSACSVKYVAFYFALAALVMVLVRAAHRRRSAAVLSAACALAALPMTAWIFFHTHNPVFPFLGNSPWALPLSPPVAVADLAVRMMRTIWDVTFARERMGLQPPITPFLVILVLLLLAAAIRHAPARWLLLLSAGYLVPFHFLPQDSRYLVPLLPLVSVAAALVVATRWPKATIPLALLAIAPGIAYAGYRLNLQGVPPPSNPSQRTEWLASRVPEYRALLRARKERIYACGAARLKSHADGPFLGDFFGLYSYDRILKGAYTTRAVAERMRGIDVRYFLLAKRVCVPPQANGGMELVYEDEAAQLWRVPGELLTSSR